MGSECDRTSVRAPRSAREYRLGEEIANAITHGIGALLAIAAIPVMIVTAVSHGGGALLASAIAFGVSMLLEYLASTLYHALAHEGAKRVFKVMDHCAIYLLIAGSYTPFCLIALADHGGFVLSCVVWAAALVGMAVEAFWVFRPRWGLRASVSAARMVCRMVFARALRVFAASGLFLAAHWRHPVFDRSRVLHPEEDPVHAHGLPCLRACRDHLPFLRRRALSPVTGSAG